jgi:hypothetical protein
MCTVTSRLQSGDRVIPPQLAQHRRGLEPRDNPFRSVFFTISRPIAAELGQVCRFDSARQLMGYCGAVPSENSSGKRTRRGGITKTGNAHLRGIVVEAAWSYRRPPCIWYGLRRRQESIPLSDAFFSLVTRVKQLFNLDECQIAEAYFQASLISKRALP